MKNLLIDLVCHNGCTHKEEDRISKLYAAWSTSPEAKEKLFTELAGYQVGQLDARALLDALNEMFTENLK